MLARQALAPVDRMAEAARRISAEHLTERLEETSEGGMSWTVCEETLNAMLGRLDDAFRQIRQFSADASHELQTPVTILKGELEVALRASGVRRTISVTCVVPFEEVEWIARLVDGLLLLRADAGVLRMDHTPVDLAQLVEEACEQTRVLADAASTSPWTWDQ